MSSGEEEDIFDNKRAKTAGRRAIREIELEDEDEGDEEELLNIITGTKSKKRKASALKTRPSEAEGAKAKKKRNPTHTTASSSTTTTSSPPLAAPTRKVSARRHPRQAAVRAGVIELSDSDGDDPTFMLADDLLLNNTNDDDDDIITSGYKVAPPAAVLKSLEQAREIQALADRLRQADSPTALTAPSSTSAGMRGSPPASPSAATSAVTVSMSCPLTDSKLTFKILKTQPFLLLLKQYINYREDQISAYFRRHSMTEYLHDKSKLLQAEGGFMVKFDGMPVLPSHTPQDFGMLENETIQLSLPPPPSLWLGELENAGIKITARRQDVNIAADRNDYEEKEEGNPVFLRLRRQDQEVDRFRIDKSSPFEKLYLFYCKKKGFQPDKVKFIFDGLPLNMRSTPDEEDMEDDDIIDVKVEPGAEFQC